MVVWNQKSTRDALRPPPVHLHPALVVESGGTSRAPASRRDRLSPAPGREASAESLSIAPSTAGEGHLRWKEAKALVAAFFSLTDGSYSKVQTHTLGLCPEKLG